MIDNMMKEAVKTRKTLKKVKKLGFLAIGVSFTALLLSNVVRTSNIFYYSEEKQAVLGKANARIQPVKSLETITTNVDNALFESFNFNSNNYDAVLDKATDKWFTESGGVDFLREVTLAGGDNSLLNRVVANKLTLQAYVLPGSGVIQSKRANNRYMWQVGASVLLTYRNQFGRGSTETIDFSVWVVERDSAKYPQGIGIESIRRVD